jgi:hypothetical protein
LGEGNLRRANIASSQTHTYWYAVGVVRWVRFVFDIVCPIDSKEVSLRTRSENFQKEKGEKE